MVDNVAITAGAGTTIAADDIGAGVLAQRVKPVWGPDGTGNDVDVASGKAMPVQVRSATGLIPIGEPTDAAATQTDTTSVSAVSLWKQISKTLQAFITLAGAPFAKITDGTNTATVKAASTAAVATDTALVVAISPNSSGSLAQGSTTSGQTGALVQGAVTTAAPTYTTAQTSPLSLDAAGNLRVITGSDVAAANLVTGAITTAMTGTTTTSLVAAPGASLHNMITQVTVSNSHATVGTDIVLQDGSGGTALYTIPAAANYGGATITFNPPLRQPTANTALFVANVTTGASTKASANGFKAA